MQNNLIICPIEKNELAQLVCFNKECKGNRIYCIECLKQGHHASHLPDQYDIKCLQMNFLKIKLKCENLITNLDQMIKEIDELSTQLFQGLKAKYSMSIERLKQLDQGEMNEVIEQMIKFDEVQTDLMVKVKECQKNLINLLQEKIVDLKLQKDIQIENQKNHQIISSDQEADNYDVALKLLDNKQFINQNYQQALLIKAQFLRMFGKYDDAITCSNKLLSIDSKNVEVLCLKACCLTMLGQWNDSIKYTDKALSYYSGHVESLYAKAKALEFLGEYDKAIKYADKALLICENHIESLALKAFCLGILNKYNESIIFTEKALTIYSEHVQSLCTRCLQILSKYKLAVQEGLEDTRKQSNGLIKLYLLIPTISSLYVQKVYKLMTNLLGYSLMKLGNYNDALIWANKALMINSNHQEILYIKSRCLQKVQKYKESIDQAEKGLNLNSKHTDLLYTKVQESLVTIKKQLYRQITLYLLILHKLMYQFQKLSAYNSLENTKMQSSWLIKFYIQIQSKVNLRVLQLNPCVLKVNKSQINLAMSLMCLSNYEESIKQVEKALQINQYHVRSLSIKGIVSQQVNERKYQDYERNIMMLFCGQIKLCQFVLMIQNPYFQKAFLFYISRQFIKISGLIF
ncbi:unnamed protein product (macronuclear) [Paramecium tetraurelia]|uniref:Tetratricopeptide repeat protein n=1 Tax=Paramecium tetraurelia TaxID=5888 RepID=A0D5H4_PARTE|nr:uncharacterized protein GSPATT00039274001 [Paramecium tetraurelia]CAK78291.1 unnamed protein product [Paramecium tetraurelia]|eukprot:XP_001445688.1 hypothetical protein (macronuclear) [Paramecium tetraurelia strain d4-2]